MDVSHRGMIRTPSPAIRAASSTDFGLQAIEAHTASIIREYTPDSGLASSSDDSDYGEHSRNDKEWDHIYALLQSFKDPYPFSDCLQKPGPGVLIYYDQSWSSGRILAATTPTSAENARRLISSYSLQAPHQLLYPSHDPARSNYLPSLPSCGSDPPSYPSNLMHLYRAHLFAAPLTCPAYPEFVCDGLPSTYAFNVEDGSFAPPGIQCDTATTGFLPAYEFNGEMGVQKTSLVASPAPSPSVKKGKGRTKSSGKKLRRNTASQTVTAESEYTAHDKGFRWLKEGRKVIKNEIYKRSYLYCDKRDVCECEAKKRTQRCSGGMDCFTITYVGSHNHLPEYTQSQEAGIRNRNRRAGARNLQF